LSDDQGVPATEVFGAGVQPLQGVRSAAGLHPQVPDLPVVFPRTRQSGQDSRSNKVELVTIMSMSDPIADMLTRIRNSNLALKPEAVMPYSRLKAEIAQVLKREGYIADFYAEKTEGGQQMLKIQLKITGKERAITGIQRISKPGLRRYVASKDIPRVLGGMGISILTTSRGVMAGHEARKSNLGGELLAFVW
jgi:small subunit ribosomal protein S8